MTLMWTCAPPPSLMMEQPRPWSPRYATRCRYHYGNGRFRVLYHVLCDSLSLHASFGPHLYGDPALRSRISSAPVVLFEILCMCFDVTRS